MHVFIEPHVPMNPVLVGFRHTRYAEVWHCCLAGGMRPCLARSGPALCRDLTHALPEVWHHASSRGRVPQPSRLSPIPSVMPHQIRPIARAFCCRRMPVIHARGRGRCGEFPVIGVIYRCFFTAKFFVF
jgi:hypothetical protein